MKEVFSLEEAALKTFFLSNQKLIDECEQFLIRNLDTQFLNCPEILRESVLDELIANRGSIIANAIINGGRYSEDQLSQLNTLKEILTLPHELITLLFEAISLRTERLETIHEKFISSFSLPYPFDVPYQYDSQNQINYAKSVISWLKKHLTAEDIRNNENVDFNLYQFALVTKDAEFFQWFWNLAGTEIQQKLLKFSIGEINPFFAAVEMGLLWFCELLYSLANTERQLTL